MKISIVIPNYNGIRLLQKNLPIITGIFNKYEIVVVDDASTDSSVEEIKYQISKIKNTNKKAKIILLQNKKNLGFSSTVNRGVKEAEGDLIILLNTDVVPESDFLKYLLPHFSDPKVFAVGFLQKCPEEGIVILRGRGVGKFEKGFLIHSRGTVSDKDTSEVAECLPAQTGTPRMVEESKKTLWVSGGAGIYRKAIWQELGGMNELYDPFYWEDIDLSYRAQKAGYKIFFESKSIVIHKRHTSAIKSNYSDEYIKKISYRNQIMFVWLDITDYDYLLKHLLYLPYHLLIALMHRDLTFIAGFFTALKQIPKILKFRMNNNKFRQISDKEILENLNT